MSASSERTALAITLRGFGSCPSRPSTRAWFSILARTIRLQSRFLKGPDMPICISTSSDCLQWPSTGSAMPSGMWLWPQSTTTERASMTEAAVSVVPRSSTTRQPTSRKGILAVRDAVSTSRRPSLRLMRARLETRTFRLVTRASSARMDSALGTALGNAASLRLGGDTSPPWSYPRTATCGAGRSLFLARSDKRPDKRRHKELFWKIQMEKRPSSGGLFSCLHCTALGNAA